MLVRLLLVACLSLFTIAADAASRDLTPDEAQRQLFPEATTWVPVPVPQLLMAIRELGRDPDITMVAARVIITQAMKGDVPLGYFVTDSVIGKFEKIDYAVALANDGSVRQVLVLKYREAHGHEIAEPGWLAQFIGKKAASPLRVEKDIDGISGATLSCVHMADGVRRVTRLVALIYKIAP